MRRAALVLCLLPLLVPAPCAAGHILIRTQPASYLTHGRILLTVSLTNAGDSPAHSLRVEARLPDSFANSEELGTLDAGETREIELELGPAPRPAGTHTIVIRTRYSDPAGHPFCVLSSIPLLTADNDFGGEQTTVSVRPAAISDRADVSVRVSNRGPHETAPHVRLLLSDDFDSPDPERNLRLAAGASTSVVFRVRNRSALAGSRYAMLATVDDSAGKLHQSVAAAATLTVVARPLLSSLADRIALAAVLLLLALFLALQRLAPRMAADGLRPWHQRLDAVFNSLALAAILVFLFTQITPALLLRDTLTVGGDVPAHSYLASHLKDQLIHHGRVISWAGGWWCGFPMFQYYFPLPYLLAALLSFLIPFNVAFKVVSVSGIFLLPPAAFLSGRLMRLPRPGPVLLAMATVPMLFDRSNTMWSVNIYSTFAGMIANSLSFPLMLLFIASAWRDADDGQFRLRTALLLAALVASHFFTSIMAGLTVALFPLLSPRAGARRALSVLLREGLLGLGLMAWWLVPLVAKRAFSMDFGEDWPVDFSRQLPGFCAAVSPLIIAAAAIGLRHRIRFVAITGWMLLCALGLFHFGYTHVSPVFVNVRLWPFIVYALLALAAAGAALLLHGRRAQAVALLAVLTAALAFGPARPNNARAWAEWNLEGLEGKPRWPIFRDLVLPLRDTPGRLSNDLHEDNDSFGSSRIFECVPHLIGKPILEGGIVNSAAGSMFAYYVQSEASRSCAGFPPIVRPSSFDITNATRHMELFNVKHFIARWSGTREALSRHPDWRLLRTAGDWSLYELTSHRGRYVYIPPRPPMAVSTKLWKEAGLDWLYTPGALEQPFAILDADDSETSPFPGVLSESDYAQCLAALRTNAPPASFARVTREVISEEVTDSRIRFTTDQVGQPHIVKCTWFPNWKVRGADRVYRVTPCFMLVYPTRTEVELYYGSTVADNAGRVVTASGILLLAVLAWRRMARARHGEFRS